MVLINKLIDRKITFRRLKHMKETTTTSSVHKKSLEKVNLPFLDTQ